MGEEVQVDAVVVRCSLVGVGVGAVGGARIAEVGEGDLAVGMEGEGVVGVCYLAGLGSSLVFSSPNSTRKRSRTNLNEIPFPLSGSTSTSANNTLIINSSTRRPPFSNLSPKNIPKDRPPLK